MPLYLLLFAIAQALQIVTAHGADAPAPPAPLLPPPTWQPVPSPAEANTLFIRQYRVIGTKILPRPDIEEAVYPYLGPGRTADDVEKARAALEKSYHDKGFQTVSVAVPQQRPTQGVIVLQVTEAPIGRLRVQGSRYYNIDRIKAQASSLAEGTVPNFQEVQRDMIALNQNGGLQVTPSLRPGVTPGTFDVDLMVKDQMPLHGSIELNNRYSANTTPLRLDIALSYSNLWQLGHTIGFGFQVAPMRPEDAIVYSGYYIAPVPNVDWLSVMVQAIRQNSNVSTLGGSAVAGNGEIYGGRLLFNLPGKGGFFQNGSFGLDYKHFTQDLSLNGSLTGSPITYYPFSLNYNASLVGKGRETQFAGGVVFSFRGLGSGEQEFDNRRFDADGNFFYFRGSLTHTQELPFGFQAFAELQGQASAVSLVDSEEFSLGGLNTVRGYLESVVLGDSAMAGTLELRSPSFLSWLPPGNEGRVFVFTDGGTAWLNNPLPEQTSQFNLWSIGLGSSVKIADHFNGSLVVGLPLISQSPSNAYEPLFTFRIWGEL